MKYFVTGWCGIPADKLSERTVTEARECGLDMLVGGYDRETNFRALDIMERCSVKFMLTDSRISECLRNPEKIDENIPAVAADYRDFPALCCYYITDEPSCGDFDTLARIVSKFRECDPEHFAYINLFPNYANAEQLGCDSYDEHVRRYMDTVKPQLLSYDHYHFLNPQEDKTIHTFTDEREAGIYYASLKRKDRAGFFDNFEIIRREGLRTGVPYMLIVLLTEHGCYRYLSEAEISWEVFQSLAYGVGAMSYFTYWTPGDDPVWHFRNGIISAEGEKTAHYYNVRSVNAATAKIGEYVAATRSRAVFHVGEESEKVSFFPDDGYDGVKITAEDGGRLTVGFYESGDFLAANKDFLRGVRVSVTADDGAQLLMLDPISGEWIAAEREMEIAAGSGVLLRRG